MKKLLLISMLFGAMPLAMMAQDDDLYFVAKKKSKVEVVTDNYGLPKDTYYEGSNRSVDEYNRRMKSTYVEIDGDSTKVDIIDFNGQKGVYPDSLNAEDFKLTKKLTRFDGYDLTDNAAYWAGYQRGRYDWGWHSPWYYRTYGWYPVWYDPWYDPWYYSWYGGWYGWRDPWYYGYYGWGYPYPYYGYYTRFYPVYYGGGYSTPHYASYHSPRQSFGTGRSSFGKGGRNTASRGSFGASYGNQRNSTSASRPTTNSGSFGASRSSGSFGGGTRSGGGGGSFGGGGGGGRSGGGGGFGRHR